MDSQMIVKLPRTVIQPPSSAARAVNGAWRDTTIWNSLNSYVLSTLCADDSAPHNIKAVWNLYGNFSFQTRYNIAIAPSQEVPVIIRNAGRNEAKLMKWGLVPSRAPDPSMGQRMINARSETLLEKPSFKQAVQKRRCLVPANGFYEWRRDGKRKILEVRGPNDLEPASDISRNEVGIERDRPF